MSTSVQLTRTTVAMMPLVLTLWAATLVPVNQDTKEMELPVQVCLMMPTQFLVLKQQLHTWLIDWIALLRKSHVVQISYLLKRALLVCLTITVV